MLPVPLSMLPALSPAAAKAVDVSPTEIIERWLASVSANTRRSYAYWLVSFQRWAMPAAAAPEDALRLLCSAGPGPAHGLVEGWRDMLLEKLAPGTVGGACAALSSLLRACRKAGLATFSLERIAPKRERVQDRSGPPRHDVVLLLGHVDGLAAKGDKRAVRDAALLRLLACCGLRRAEAAGLDVADVDLERGLVWPRRKGFKQRAATSVSTNTVAALRAWLAVRGSEAGPLFCRLDRARAGVARISGEAVRCVARDRSRAAGVRVVVRPHGLRHAGATFLAEHASLDQLMAFGAWKSLSSASAYLDSVDGTRAKALAIVDA